ncbi:MAG: fructose 1,6-bisphosphatase [Candidatus Omnitrophica bacterium]|nr:fructose 1,6-bisphosphatase [Candidatus Omnitrophota bacterium]
MVDRLAAVQKLLAEALDDDTLVKIAEEVKAIAIYEDPIDDKALDFLNLILSSLSDHATEEIRKLRKVLVDDTRLVAVLAREGSLEERRMALAAIGDLRSSTHKAIVSFGGRRQYTGSRGIKGGPRSMYLDLTRLEEFEAKATDTPEEVRSKMDDLRLWLTHEYKDLARGYCVDEEPAVMARLNNRHRAIEEARLKQLSADEKQRAAKANPMTVSMFGAEIGKFLNNSKTVPPETVNGMRTKLDAAVQNKLIEDYHLVRVGSRINLFILHRKGEGNPEVNTLIQSAFEDAIGMPRVTPNDMRFSFGEATLDFQLGKTIAFVITDRGGVGATDIALWRAWSDPARSDAIPNVTAARPGFFYELDDIEDGTTHFVHSYDTPDLTALVKEGRHVVKRIWKLRRDAKGSPIPFKARIYTAEEVKQHLDEPVAFTVTETAGFKPNEHPDSFNSVALVNLQTDNGPDVGEFNSSFFTTSPIVLTNNGEMAPVIPVSVNELASPPLDGAVRVAILGFEPLPNGKLTDIRGYPTQVGDVLGNYQFEQQAEEGRFMQGIIQRHPVTFEPRRAFGARKAELEKALAAVEAYPTPEPDLKHPGQRVDYRPPYRRSEPKIEVPNPVTIVIGKGDIGGQHGHDEVAIVFSNRERELVMDAYQNCEGKVNRGLIADALKTALVRHYDSDEHKEKAAALLSNAQGEKDPKTQEVVFPTELANIGKALLTKEDARALLKRVCDKILPLDAEIRERILDEAYADPTVYIFKKGDILGWRHWRESGDDSGFLLVMSGHRKFAPELHSLYIDIKWEVVYSKGPQVGVYGLAQDLSEKGVSGNTKGSGLGMSIIETDASIAEKGLVLNLNDKSNAGAYSLPMLEYLKGYPEPVLVEVLDPFENKVRYYNSHEHYAELQEVLGVTDKYSIKAIWALPGTTLAKEYPFLLDHPLSDLSSEKLFLIFGRYKGKDDAALAALMAFLKPTEYAQAYKRPFFVVGDNRGINMNLIRPIRSDQPQAIAHDGASLVLQLNVSSYKNIDPVTGEILDVEYEFDKPEYNDARNITTHGNRILLAGTSPFEPSKVPREAAEYSMAGVVEKDLATLGLTIPTIRQKFVTLETAAALRNLKAPEAAVLSAV